MKNKQKTKETNKHKKSNLFLLSFSDLLDKMLLILLGVLVLHLIILILLTVSTAASVSVSPQCIPLKKWKKVHYLFLCWN